MDVFNRLKNTVSGVMMGNPVTREFEISTHRASAGPGLLWKVYDGIKHTTKQEVSVFVFEKKLIERYSRRDKELIVESMKKAVSQLTRLRHPKILSVLHPIEESRESLAFATEPVFSSLANILHQTINAPATPVGDMVDFKLYDVEIKYGFLQLTEGLAFLHNDVKMVHGNICPSSIIINKSGSWKLSGFDCAIPNANNSDATPYFAFKEWDPSMPPLIQAELDYMAPEYILTMSNDTMSDMFSLGMLFQAVFNDGKTLFECREQINIYKQNVEELRNLTTSVLGSVPHDIREHVKLMLNAEPTVRPDAHQLSKIPFFEDLGANTLHYLDTLMQRKNLEKSQFFKGLPQVIDKLPKRVNLQRILIPLEKECMNADMVPFVLPALLLIAEQCTTPEYTTHVMPVLIPLFKIANPIQVTLIFLQNMTLLLSKTPQNDIKNHVLPMMYRALECNTPQIQELCLSIIPTFASLIEYSSIKNAVIPRIKKLCLTTQTLSLRVSSLMCMGKMLEYMDKWFVLDEVFPILKDVPSREPAVLMSILGIYKVTLDHKKLGITKEIMATKVLPYIMLLSIDNNLNLQQYNAFTSVIHDMMQRVETEHRSKLEQLSSMQQEQRTLQFTNESIGESKKLVGGVSEGAKEQTMMDKFLSGFGLSSISSDPVTNGPSATNNGSTLVTPTGNKTDETLSAQTKGSLSMQEKQRLAQQQEQVQRFKQQSALTVTSKPTTNQSMSSMNSQSPASKQSNNQSSSMKQTTTNQGARDLTSTLVNSPNFMSNGNKPSNLPSGMSQSTYPAMGTSATNPFMGSGTTNNKSSAGNTFMQTGVLSPTNQQQSSINSNKKMDLSAFDTLLPTASSNQPKQSMNTMAQSYMPAQSNPPPMSMGYMGGNSNMMSSTMMGGMQQNQQPNFNNMMNKQNNANSADFDTLFG